MTKIEAPEDFRRLVHEYVDGNADARELIQGVDDLVGDDKIATWSSELRSAILELQDELALCVFDDATLQEAPGIYFSVAELPSRVREFVVRNGSIFDLEAERVRQGT